MSELLDIVDEDFCCASHLGDALLEDNSITAWSCPKCGTEWFPHVDTSASVRNWQPNIIIDLFTV